MSDQYRDLHGDAYKEWKENAANNYAQAQRRAFLDGFESAANEGKRWNLLREWVEEERDKAERKGQERDDGKMMFARSMAFKDVLVKLHEMGNEPKNTEAQGDE
jgi:hypothetical protein